MLIVSFIFLTTYISVYEQMGLSAGVADTLAVRTRNIRQRLRLGWYVGKTSMWVGESMEDHFADVWNRSLNTVEMEISCRASHIPYACVRTRLALDGSLLCPAGCLASRWSSVAVRTEPLRSIVAMRLWHPSGSDPAWVHGTTSWQWEATTKLLSKGKIGERNIGIED